VIIWLVIREYRQLKDQSHTSTELSRDFEQ